MANDLLMEHSKSAIFPEGLDLSGLSSISVPNSSSNEVSSQNSQQPAEEEKLDLTGIAPINLVKQKNKPIAKEENLDLSGIDPISVTKSQHKIAIGEETLDLTNIKPVKIDAKLLDFKFEKPDLTIEERSARGAVAFNKPIITVENPHSYVGKSISTIVTMPNAKAPDKNTLVDAWLNQIDPNYKLLNQEYRNASAYHSNLVDFDVPKGQELYQSLGNYQYKFTSKFQKGAQEIINAYINGRNGGDIQDGLEAVYHKQLDLKRQDLKVREQINNTKFQDSTKFRNKHPYLASIPIVAVLASDAGLAGIAEVNIQNAQLIHNLRILPEAIYKLEKYGGDSQEYLDLMEKDANVQKQLDISASENFQPKTILGKIVKGTVAGVASLPKYALAGEIGGSYSLPMLVYVENLHRGNREAAISALPMAVMAGGMHGLNEFLGAGTRLNINTVDEAGNPINKTIEVGRGLGNKAPFTFKGARQYIDEFSNVVEPGLKTKIASWSLESNPQSIKALTSFERQLLLRGTNALSMSGATAITGADFKDTVSSFVVGLTFPIGKSPRGNFNEGQLFLNPPRESPVAEVIVPKTVSETRIPQQLSQDRIDVPLSEPSKLGKLNVVEQRRDVGNTFVPSYESPNNKYKENTTLLEPNLEKGFQARNEPANLRLDLDTAALNLLDLKRAQKDASWKVSGLSIKDALNRQIAIGRAISILKKAIPPETLKFFAENEQVIRASLKTNYEATQAKAKFLNDKEALGKQETKEQTPSNIESHENIPIENEGETPTSRLERTMKVVSDNKLENNPQALNEVAKNVLGDTGSQNTWITPDKVLLAMNRHAEHVAKFKTEKGMGLNLIEGSKDLLDMTQIAAFHLEDFYHRNIKPGFSEFKNRLKVTMGDLVDGISDKEFQMLFDKGNLFLSSNIADPFFSKMKQDAVEKLPNKMTAEQALNVLKGHKNEYEWTVGLEKSLNDKKVDKFSKQELIDVIQKGQVRVEVSIASEIKDQKVENRLNEISQRQRDILKINGVDDPALLLDNSSDEKEYYSIQREWENLYDRYSPTPKYSLKAYTGEKLELPGAVNSKEVKLILNIKEPLAKTSRESWILSPDKNVSQVHDEFPIAWENKETGQILWTKSENNHPADELYEPEKYQAPHWDEPNVVAHYRSNDRITTDGKRAYHSEEFQSDWNHDIREKGLKVKGITKENYESRGYEIIHADVGSDNEGSWILKPKGSKSNVDILGSVTDHDLGTYNQISKEDAIRIMFSDPWGNPTESSGGNVEPNPFMSHNWKELILKRFLRDAVVAKDENGNYKYDGVSWTTARQQAERYGNILEGKDFYWSKNNNGTYDFKMMMPGNGEALFPHELQNISLERFAELTTKEVADFVREQENKLNTNEDGLPSTAELKFNRFTNEWEVFEDGQAKVTGKTKERALEIYWHSEHNILPSGKFSLKEAVELRGGMGTWADYDVAFVNNAKKIGKRFNAEYSMKEIDVTVSEAARTRFDKDRNQIDNSDIQKVHYLEITPSMRESLEREGFSLYGLGGSEPVKSSEQGIRNKVINLDVFNSARESLIARLEETISTKEKKYEDLNPEERVKFQQDILNTNKEDASNMQLMMEGSLERMDKKGNGTVFNSGLNPNAFIDQIKLLYRGYNDLVSFTNDLVKRYGEPIKEFAEDLWYQVKGFASEFNDKLSISIDEWQANLSKNVDNRAWQIRQGKRKGSLKGDLGGILGRKKSLEEIEYLTDPEKHQSQLDYRYGLRMIALAQVSSKFNEVYESMRLAQRVTNSYGNNILKGLKLGNSFLKSGMDKAVAEAIYSGNETKTVYSDPELVKQGLNPDQIKAYRNVRNSIDNVLNLRQETVLYSLRTKANKLNEDLINATTPTEADAIKEKLLDLDKTITRVNSHYDELRNTGYITLQRQGKIAAAIEDPSLLIGDPNRLIYNQFNSKKEAFKWMEEQKKSLGIPSNVLAGKVYDLRNDVQLSNLVRNNKLTPSQFEELVDGSSANAKSPEIEKLRAEVYANFPSMTFQLSRKMVRGYDRTWKNVVDSTVHQADLYGSSYYSKVGGEEARIALEKTGLQKSDPNLYKIAASYINDEITPANKNFYNKGFAYTRRMVYVFQLAYDVSQLYLNAGAQPITQTYGYFSRIEYNGKRLSGVEPEQYFIRAGALVKDAFLGKATPEFEAIRQRLTDEHVLFPEFSRSLIGVDEVTGILSKKTATTIQKLNPFSKAGEHWASVFMRAGEKTTRTHAAAEAFLVGKEKFNLKGEDLVKFMVRAIDATQSNPTKGENPYFIRAAGEGGKLFYQFSAFNQMWWENLALGTVLDKTGTIGQKAKFTTRELYPLILMGGLRGLPLTAFASALYTGVTGDDPKKKFDKLLGKDSLLEQMSLYGLTTSSAFSSKSTPSAPILDSASEIITGSRSPEENIPLYATGEQIVRFGQALISGDVRKIAKTIPLRAVRGITKSINATGIPGTRITGEGFKDSKGNSMITKSKVTRLQALGQAINISPNKVIETYEEQRTKKLKEIIRKRKLGRQLQNRMRQIF